MKPILLALLASFILACSGAPDTLSGMSDPTTPTATVSAPAAPDPVALSTSDAGTVNQMLVAPMPPNFDSGSQVQTFGNDAAFDAGSAPDTGHLFFEASTDAAPDASNAAPDAGTAEYCTQGIPAECYLECTPGSPWQCIANGKQGFRYTCRFDISVPNSADVHTLMGDDVGTYPPQAGNCWVR